MLLTNGRLDVCLGIFRQRINAFLPNCTNCVTWLPLHVQMPFYGYSNLQIYLNLGLVLRLGFK